jgi:hypothetical protein
MKNLMVCLVVLAGCGSSATQGVGDDNPDAMTSEVDAHTDGDTVDATPDSGQQTCTADTQNDPSNCGLCGRSCLGGLCSMGRCEATPLTGGDISGIGDFTTDGLFMYYTGFTTGTSTNHRLWRLAIGPATNTDYVSLFANPTPMTQISFDGTYFYSAEPMRIDTIDRAVVRKTNKEPFATATLAEYQKPTTTAALFYNGNVYYASDLDAGTGGDIKRVSANGGSISTVTVLAGIVSYIGADANSLYWVDNGAGGLQDALRRAPIGGGATVEMTRGVADFLDLDATRVYMVRKNTGELISIAKTGGAPAILGTGMTAGGAVDDEYVYAAKTNQLIGVTKTGTNMGVLWEGEPQGTPQCPTVMKITRTKVIGDYVYFLVKPTTCNNVELLNQIYRMPRL